MTDRVLAVALADSLPHLRLNAEAQELGSVRLLVAAGSPHGPAVMVDLAGALPRCALGTCAVQVRFDSLPAQVFRAAGDVDGADGMLMLLDAARFIAGARKARRILMEIPIAGQGRQVAEWQVPQPLNWPLPQTR